MKKFLLIASRPLANDGLTKIEMDVINYNKNVIEFEVACGFGFDNPYGKQLKEGQIKCYSLPTKSRSFSYMKAIYKLVKKEKYDGVYIHGNSAMMFLEAIPSKLAGTYVVTHCHNTKSNYPLVHYIVKPFFNAAVDAKIGCSSLASRWAYCGKNMVTIVNGVDIEQFRYDEQKRSEVIRRLGWTNNKIVGHIGRFSTEKNHEKLIRIFGEMYKKDPSVRLLLIGEGCLRSVIEMQITKLELSDVVRIIEYTDKPQDYMNVMDIMIIPSLSEGLCLVAIEAQANGMPVLISHSFPPETHATNLVRELDLEDDDSIWAETALRLIYKRRQDVTDQLIGKGLDKKNMLSEIQQLLVKQKVV